MNSLQDMDGPVDVPAIRWWPFAGSVIAGNLVAAGARYAVSRIWCDKGEHPETCATMKTVASIAFFWLTAIPLYITWSKATMK